PSPSFRRPPRLDGLSRRCNQLVDLRDRKHFRQRSSALRPLDDGGWIVRTVSLHAEKAVQLADRRKPPCHRRCRKAAISKRGQIGPQIGRGGGQNRAFAGREVARQVIEVARISLKRIRRATALCRHHIEKQRGQSPLRGVRGCHPSQRCCLIKRSGGTVTTISRGLGWTKVTSANMAPSPGAAIATTTASHVIMVRMAASRCVPLGAPSWGEYDHFRHAMARANFGETNFLWVSIQ